MFQNLLAVRFKLQVHREPREISYKLVVSKEGLKMRQAAPDANAGSHMSGLGRPFRLENAKMSMQEVSDFLWGFIRDRAVINRTEKYQRRLK